MKIGGEFISQSWPLKTRFSQLSHSALSVYWEVGRVLQNPKNLSKTISFLRVRNLCKTLILSWLSIQDFDAKSTFTAISTLSNFTQWAHKAHYSRLFLELGRHKCPWFNSFKFDTIFSFFKISCNSCNEVFFQIRCKKICYISIHWQNKGIVSNGWLRSSTFRKGGINLGIRASKICLKC